MSHNELRIQHFSPSAIIGVSTLNVKHGNLTTGLAAQRFFDFRNHMVSVIASAEEEEDLYPEEDYVSAFADFTDKRDRYRTKEEKQRGKDASRKATKSEIKVKGDTSNSQDISLLFAKLLTEQAAKQTK